MQSALRRSLPVLALLLFVAVAVAAQPDGKAVFASQKCSLCHSVQSAGIERTVKSSKAKDLSTVGSERDAAWLTKWLKKQEMIDGKPHQKAFSGTDAEMTALVQYLETLKKK